MYRLLQRFTRPGLFALQFFLLGQAAIADIPRTLNYQGILTDNSGTVVADGDYDLTFTLYDASSGGNAVWTETHTLTVIDGLFSAALGAQTALDIPFDTPYWLGIAIDTGNDLDPRTPLMASAYALGVAASVLDGIHTLSSADGSITGALSVNNNGNVGINTRTPRDLLDVRSRSATQTTLDQSQETFNTVTTANDVWQSFTPDRTGDVTSIEVSLDDPFSGAAPAAGIFEIYEGEGTAGTRLHDGPVDIADLPDSAFVIFSVDPPVPVSADSIYTFRLSVPASDQDFVELSNSNPYLGGRASTGTDDDLAFKVSIRSLANPACYGPAGRHRHRCAQLPPAHQRRRYGAVATSAGHRRIASHGGRQWRSFDWWLAGFAPRRRTICKGRCRNRYRNSIWKSRDPPAHGFGG